jgi:hypothetical protein
MHDPLTKLQAVAVPAESDGARDRALSRLQARIDAPVASRSPRRVKRPRLVRAAALAGAAAVAVAAGVSALPSAGPNATLALLGKAVAAYAPQPQTILYQRTTTRDFGRSSDGAIQQISHEQDWSLPGVGFRTLHTDAHGRTILDEALSRSRRRQYTAGRPFIDQPRSKMGEPVDGSANPFTVLLAAAKRGRLTLRREGTQRVDGKLTDAFAIVYKSDHPSATPDDLIYVDRVTQLPVRLVEHFPPGYDDTGLGGTVAMEIERSVTDFDVVRALPATPANRRLLELPARHAG